MKKYYLAYGSNLSVQQMAQRCPEAIYVGKAEIPDYRLLFKGSKTGSYLTIEPYEGGRVPALVWQISERDELNLDRYEGYPTFYYKKNMEIEITPFVGEDTETAEALVYIMHEERPLGCPALRYYDICLEGYYRFGFEEEILQNALRDSVGKRTGNKMLKEVGYYG